MTHALNLTFPIKQDADTQAKLKQLVDTFAGTPDANGNFFSSLPEPNSFLLCLPAFALLVLCKRRSATVFS